MDLLEVRREREEGEEFMEFSMDAARFSGVVERDNLRVGTRKVWPVIWTLGMTVVGVLRRVEARVGADIAIVVGWAGAAAAAGAEAPIQVFKYEGEDDRRRRERKDCIGHGQGEGGRAEIQIRNCEVRKRGNIRS
jgi:hypothetical protein